MYSKTALGKTRSSKGDCEPKPWEIPWSSVAMSRVIMNAVSVWTLAESIIGIHSK